MNPQQQQQQIYQQQQQQQQIYQQQQQQQQQMNQQHQIVYQPQQIINSNVKTTEYSPLLDSTKRRLLCFAHYLYAMDPHTGSYDTVSEDSNWSTCDFPVEVNGSIYVVSKLTGYIFSYNINDKTFSTVSKESWLLCVGMVELNGFLYLVCDHIYKMNPQDGKYEKVSGEGGWGIMKHHTICVYNGFILMVNGLTGAIIAWNPKDTSFRTVSKDYWVPCKSIVNVQGKIYCICHDIYELNVEDGTYKKISNSSGWQHCNNATVQSGLIYILLEGPGYFTDIKTGMFEINTGIGTYNPLTNTTQAYYSGNYKHRIAHIWVFNPQDGSYKKISGDNWAHCKSIY